MKVTVALVAAVSATIASAQPHRHGHFHKARRGPSTVTVKDPVQTAWAFVLNGETIGRDEVCSGISQGSLKFEGGTPPDICGTPNTINVPPPSSAAPTSSAAAAQFFEKPSSSAPPPPPSSSAPPAPSSSQQSQPASPPPASPLANLAGFMQFTSQGAQGSYPDFQNGKHRCSDGPPADYGAVHVSWLKGGWASIQKVSGTTLLGDSDACVPGTLCAFACAAGYQMAQWPEAQPAGGQSIGGLRCNDDGFLETTNDNPQICSTGNGQVYVENEGHQGVSICRTIYPGDESETVPLWVPAGSTQPLTCPIETEFYKHLGALTSAEYYLNQPGLTPDKACTWDGMGDGDSGNWAPIVLGAGSTDGKSWLSIQENTPTSHTAFKGTVEIVGDGCNGKCSYSNGQFCYNGDCKPTSQDGAGCTTACTGRATFVINN